MSNEKKKTTGYHWRYVIEKPDPFRSRAVPNQFCHQMRIEAGELVRCMAETAGRTYCPDCIRKRETVPVGKRYMQYWRV